MPKETQTFTSNVDRKRAIVFGTIMLFIMVIATGVTGLLSSKLQKNEEERLVTTIGAILGESISRISFSGKYHSRLLIEEMKSKIPELAYISVETTDGVVAAHTDRLKNDTSIRNDDLKNNQKILNSGETVVSNLLYEGIAVKEVVLPYKTGFADEQIGVVRIGINVADVQKDQRSNLFIQILMIFALTLSGIWIMLIISNYFSKKLAKSELALRKSEEFARTLMDIPTLAVFMIDRDGICLDTNETLLKRFNKKRSEMIGKPIWGIFPPDISFKRQEIHKRILAEKRPIRFEDERQGMWNDAYLEPIIGKNGEVERLIVMGLDITDRKHAEEELRKSTERFSRIAATIPGVIYDYILFPDGSSHFLYLSPRFTEIFEIDADMAINDINSVWSCIHPDDAPRLKKEDEYANRTGTFLSTQVRIITPSGKEKWIQFESRPNPAPPGQPAVWSGVILDISQRKIAETELEKEKIRNETASQAAGVIFWEWEIKTGKMIWSKYIYQMLGVEDGKSPDHIDDLIKLIHFDDKEQVLDKLNRHLKLNEPYNLECRVRRYDGSYIWWHAMGSAIRSEEGDPISMAGAIVDITDLKRAEAEKHHLEQQMLHVQKLESLGVLAGGIAHDFNNILLAILGNAELAMLHIPPSSGAANHLKEIEKAAEKAADLSRQMLAYSGKGLFVIETIDPNRLINDMLHMLEISISKKAILRIHLADQIPSIEGDATQIRQIIMNLVMNASESMEDRGGTISLTTGWLKCNKEFFNGFILDKHLDEGIYAFFEIADTGCGMNQETLSKIFDPFFTTKFTGRGLGMAAVSGIVRAHKGAIKITSELGKGTIFTVFLPGGDKALPKANIIQNKEKQFWSGKVLLVDDEDPVRIVAREMLTKLGFEVVTASDGIEALKIFKTPEKFRFILLDLTMPHLDGEQTFSELTKIDSEAKVIISSGYNEQEISEKFKINKPTGFIQKPYRLSTLREIVAKTISD